jgi:hypothetical protein
MDEWIFPPPNNTWKITHMDEKFKIVFLVSL